MLTIKQVSSKKNYKFKLDDSILGVDEDHSHDDTYTDENHNQ